ncbi:MAG TPA: aquaporin [Pyrinomonadaceae bacterium]|nr:aquaporin [Pyrinomonadaceae bacterium]
MLWAALKNHWPEYLIEAAGLGCFMVSACGFAVVLFHPASPAVVAVPEVFVRRVLMGAAMGATAVAIIYSPWGARSGAHINPATTLTFLRLGKIRPPDALFYTAAQFAGGVAGVLFASALLGAAVAAPEVNYAVTKPGAYGVGVAFAAEAVISFVLMTVVLNVSNSRRLARWTGLCAGALVALYITVEDPLSGMSMNPARSFSSAFGARAWTALWLYFTAPPLGMLAAAETFARTRGARAVRCAKLNHENTQRCIFNCDYKEVRGQRSEVSEDKYVEAGRAASFETAKLLLTSNL